MNLDNIIEFENESTTLDFKKEQYHKQKYESMIKDIIAMANAESTDVKRIIFGVKQTPGEDNHIFGLESDILDQATFENVIQDNVEPNMHLKYFTYNFKGKKIGILEIFNNSNKPYMMKKDYKTLSKGDAWIRKGSRQSRLIREDLDKIFEVKRNTVFEEDILLGFGRGIEKKYSVARINYQKIKGNMPSDIERKRLNDLLYNHHEKMQSQIKPSTDMAASIIESFNKKIKIGNNQTGLPIFCSETELRNLIDNVEENYREYDNYYLFEKEAQKLNFYIENKGTKFLEDTIIKVRFDASVFIVSEEILTNPAESTSFMSYTRTPEHYYEYPIVYKEDGYFIVEQEHEIIRHKEPTKVFFEELRILINPNAEFEKSEIKYQISARNLPGKIEGSLIINIES